MSLVCMALAGGVNWMDEEKVVVILEKGDEKQG